MRNVLRSLALSLAWASGTAALPAAGATSLDEAWAAAQAHDRALALAATERGVADALRTQADAMWRPVVNASAALGAGGSATHVSGAAFEAPGMSRAESAVFDTAIPVGASLRAGVTVRKPIVSGVLSSRERRLRLAAEAGELQWQASRNDALLRVAGSYFASALANARVTLLAGQRDALDRAAAEAHDRFRLGSVPVTDTHEADAALAAVRAEQADADAQAHVALRALADATGIAAPEAMLPGGPPPAAAMAPAPDTLTSAGDASPTTLDAWIATAQQRDFRVRLQRLGVQIAEEAIAEHARRAQLAVDLVGEARHERLHGPAWYGSGAASQTGMQYGVGVQVSIPLFDGGQREARGLQAVREAERAQAALALTQEQTALSVRRWWLAKASLAERIRALEQAQAAGQSRLDATLIGHRLGERTLLERLDAQNALARTQLALQQARVDAWLAWLQLLSLVDALPQAALASAASISVPASAHR